MIRSSNIQTVLWDIPPEEVDALPERFLIQRALSYGSIFLVVALIKKYGRDGVKKVFAGMKPTAMPKRRYQYFRNYLFS